MKATNIIATIAAFLLFASAPTLNAQRGPLRQSNSGGGDTRGSHTAAQSHSSRPSASSNNGGGHREHAQAAPSHNNGGNHNRPQAAQSHNHHNTANNRPMGHGGNPVRRAEGGHVEHHHHSAPAPSHHHHEPVHHHAAPAPQHHHVEHHHEPVHHHHAPAPRHYAAPARTFCPRHYGPKPVYHHHIDRRARVFYIDEVPYYTYGGVYYRYVPSYGYEEIYMPEDVVVTDLPYGASRVYVNEIGYYEADGMWFQPVDGGYLLVEKPVAHVTVAVPRPTISFHASFGF